MDEINCLYELNSGFLKVIKSKFKIKTHSILAVPTQNNKTNSVKINNVVRI